MPPDALTQLALLDRLQLPALQFDALGRCHDVTAQACRLLGAPRELLLKDGFIRALPEAEASDLRRADEAMYVAKRHPHAHYYIVHCEPRD